MTDHPMSAAFLGHGNPMNALDRNRYTEAWRTFGASIPRPRAILVVSPLVFAGSAGVNPAMVLVSGALILAWRNAGWYGLDRWVLPALGTPWHRGELVDLQALERHREASAAPVPPGQGRAPDTPVT